MRRLLTCLLAVLIAVALAPAASGAAAPVAPTKPGGLPGNVALAQADDGHAVAADQAPGNCSNANVHCKPDLAGTCTTNTSQTTPPATIRVLVGTSNPTIKVVPFRDYVADSLYQEWVPSWNGDAVKAGAVAVKSFAWYWVTQRYGGYVGSTATASSCFDISDDPNFFQKYVAGTGSEDAKTVARVAATWPVAIRYNGKVVQAQYRDGLGSDPTKDTCGYLAGGTPDSIMSQYGTEACNTSNDSNNGYRYNVILKLYYGNDIDLTTPAQLRTQHDFTYTRRSTGGSFANGRWYIADGYPTTFSFGQKGDIPLAATTGDGFANAAVYRPSTATWYLANALHRQRPAIRYGTSGDIPVAAHYHGLDAPTQLAVFRPSTGVWFFATSTGATESTVQFGTRGDIPVPGRWSSSTADSLAVWRPANGAWYVPGQPTVAWGARGDVPVPADYNGDGKTDIAVYRPSTHAFYVRGASSLMWGTSGDVPVTGDFDGDGKADFAVYRPSTGVLYIKGQTSVAVGKGTPIGAAPLRG